MTKRFERDYGPEAPTFIDLFCGCGGTTLGFIKAGFNHLCGIDIARDALKTYQFNIGNAIRADVRYLPIRPDLRPYCVHGSPPCAGFSRLNFHRSKAKYAKQRKLLLWFVATIEYLQPKAISFENIPEARRYPEFWKMLEMLQFEIFMPYDVAWKILDAADYGVPQHRRRIILIGFKKEKIIGLMELPLPPYPLLPLSNSDLPKDPLQAQLLEYPMEASS